MKKRAKIVATIGPATDSLGMIIKLIKAGVNVFRLNFSHGTHEYHKSVLDTIVQAQKETGLVVGVLQDISGPKIRIGELDVNFILNKKDIIIISKKTILGTQLDKTTYTLSINQPEILEQINIGDKIYFYDGKIQTKTIEISDEEIKVEVINSGTLSSRKGVNFPNTKLGIDVLTEKDREDIKWGVENNVDFMAISFVQNAQDMINAREVVNSYNGVVQLFAKIEKFDAVENIDEILAHSDGIMVARGDLGIEVPYYDVPSIQKILINKANELSKPVITATQMLLSMTNNNSATRAEISDVANAVLDGSDAVMLSEETAVGEYPIEAVKTMVNTIKSAEAGDYPYYKFGNFSMHDSTDSINYSAARLSNYLSSAGIITITNSGDSAKKIARYRPRQTIYAVSHSEKTTRSLTIVWGVVPAFRVEKGSIARMLNQVLIDGVSRDVISLDNSYILTAGDPAGVSGSTNMIRILRRDEMMFFMKLDEQFGKKS